MKKSTFEVHVTDRATFKFCRRKWKYQCKEHLVPVTEARNALWIGRGLHYGLAHYYRGVQVGKKHDPMDGFNEWLNLVLPKDVWDALWPEELAQIESLKELASSMLSGYVKKYSKEDDFEIVAVEEPIRIPVPGVNAVLIGTLDLLVRRKKRLWVVDHKNVSNFADPEYLDFDDQMTAYLWEVWKKYGEFPAGAIYNQLRKKIPAVPDVLKSGAALSKNKGIDTTPEIYREAIQKYGFNEADYTDILLSLQHNEFYRRELVARNHHELETFSANLTAEIKEMMDPKIALYPHPNKDCIFMCPYKTLSRAESSGGDVEALKASSFEVRLERRL